MEGGQCRSGGREKGVLRWVVVFGRANYLGISPIHLSQLSLLPYAGREISAVMLCGLGVKAGWLIPLVNKRVGAGKTV